MNRVGAPLIFLKVDKLTTQNAPYIQAFTQKWGKDTGFILPEKDWEIVDPHIHDTNVAMERMAYLRDLINSYFNPGTALRQATGANSLGKSMSPAADMINAYVNNTLAWIEDGFEDIFNEWLDLNGYKAKGYYCTIEFPRLTNKNDEQITADIGMLGKFGAITPNEMRSSVASISLPALDDPKYDEPVQVQIPQGTVPTEAAPQYNPGGTPGPSEERGPVMGPAQTASGKSWDQGPKTAPSQGETKIGNLQDIKDTEIYSKTERDLIASTRRCKAEVMRDLTKNYKAKIGNVAEYIKNIESSTPDLVMSGADPRPDSDYDPIELEAGISEELMQHTTDPATAKALAKNMLDFDPVYYTHRKQKAST